jgi:hypothetical protein
VIQALEDVSQIDPFFFLGNPKSQIERIPDPKSKAPHPAARNAQYLAAVPIEFNLLI